MARKKSRLSMVIWGLLTALSGGGVSGYFKPDLPIIGPLVEKVMARGASGPGKAILTQVAGQTAIGAGGSTPARPAGQAYGGHATAQYPSAQYPSAQYPSAQYASTQSANSQYANAQYANAQQPAQSLLISSFNIQVLGKSKMSKPEVVEILARVIRQFDIVAIQEVRAKEDDIVPSLVAAVNADGSRYSYLIGPRLGRTVSTEQYAFVFDTTRVEHEPISVGTISDPADMLHREPFVARFRARTHSPQHAVTFWLFNSHTDPDEVPQEVAALADVFQVMQAARADEDDVILLGDLNASPQEFGRLGSIPGITCAINGVMTNTRQSKAYDNILFHHQQTGEFTGRWGVFSLEHVFGLSQSEALKVSDHLPVWAEFHVWEAPSQARFAGQPPAYQR